MADWHVRNREQMVKLDPEVAAKLLATVRLEVRLRWWQKRTDRVVDEIEPQLAAVAQTIKPAQRFQAFGEDTLAPLLLHVLGTIAGSEQTSATPFRR
jgi:hypothetical protein